MRYILAQDPARMRGRWLNGFAARIGRSYGLSGSISVVFVSPAEMTRLNAAYRGIAKPTDVLSFSFLRDVGSPRSTAAAKRSTSSEHTETAGEIIFCLPVVRRKARERRGTLRDELRFLLTHATLHILGYDHARDRDARAMEKLERRLLARGSDRLAKP